jgi:DNA-binding transcriptional ArsR family regulator
VLRPELASLLALNPPVGYFPDFLTPAESQSGFDVAVETILSTPTARLRTETELVTAEATPRAAAAIDGLRRGELTAVRDLGDGLRRYKELVLDTSWDRIATAFAADRAVRARQLADEGLGSFLSQLHPTAEFHDGILHIGSWGVAGTTRDLYLDGRGLTIIPCYFKRAHQLMVLADNDLPPVLVYPIDRDIKVLAAAQHQALAELLGHTRARVLESAGELTTSEVAARLNLSLPAASKHLTLLRNAGLVTSVRYGNSVMHAQTPLGMALLNGGFQ